MRLIDADKLIEEGYSLERTYQKDSSTMVLERRKLEDVPVVDAVSVVRCKDCSKECFRDELQRDIEENRSVFIGTPLAYSHLGSTVECKLAKETNVPNKVWKGEWVSCKDRLPEEDENVLVSVHFDVPRQDPNAGWYVDIASQIDGHWVSYSDEYKIARDLHKVVAWMPLPDPWKE